MSEPHDHDDTPDEAAPGSDEDAAKKDGQKGGADGPDATVELDPGALPSGLATDMGLDEEPEPLEGTDTVELEEISDEPSDEPSDEASGQDDDGASASADGGDAEGPDVNGPHADGHDARLEAALDDEPEGLAAASEDAAAEDDDDDTLEAPTGIAAPEWLKPAIEAIALASTEPLTVSKVREVLKAEGDDIAAPVVRRAFRELLAAWADDGVAPLEARPAPVEDESEPEPELADTEAESVQTASAKEAEADEEPAPNVVEMADDDVDDAPARPGPRAFGRGIRLVEVGGGIAFRTAPDHAHHVRRFLAAKPARLGRAALEALSIVAYRQPITRPQIDEVRGVDSSNAIKTLLDKKLLRVLGKADDVGRPLIYGTTRTFLEFFGLKSLSELPTLREIQALDGTGDVKPHVNIDDEALGPVQVMDLFRPDDSGELVSAETEAESKNALKALERALGEATQVARAAEQAAKDEADAEAEKDAEREAELRAQIGDAEASSDDDGDEPEAEAEPEASADDAIAASATPDAVDAAADADRDDPDAADGPDEGDAPAQGIEHERPA